ncbi:LysR family transcriptional regulator [Clostridium sp. C105KSO13]|uniref:LysR family transcriptional regulator n=1 Tax=Clostridium sp. C105KSO13 TaxID=1776045 RepID=UPI000740738E|nr:LysR family transcriptional regulator [Clostridium sp. C105KSO13]CUX30876.1 HTH-type transcriptional regulator CysL [Clostridium sp. C105KSO13]
MLDFRMKTFLKVCDCMNFTRAAEELNITQPAVSQHVRYLEKYYKVRLFAYEGKKLRLTEQGEMLRSAALTMLHDELSLKSRLAHLPGGKREIRFGATMTVGEVVMPKVLQDYLLAFPEVQLHMEVANTQELLKRLDTGKIDFAVVEGFFKKTEYDFLHYSTEKFVAVCGFSYYFQRKIERLEDLFGERLLLREPGSGTREVLERFLDSQNYGLKDFEKTAEIGNLHTIKELVKAGLGITFLYETAVKKELKEGALKLINLKNCQIYHDFTFIWPRGSIYAEFYRNLFCQFTGINPSERL